MQLVAHIIHYFKRGVGRPGGSRSAELQKLKREALIYDILLERRVLFQEKQVGAWSANINCTGAPINSIHH